MCRPVFKMCIRDRNTKDLRNRIVRNLDLISENKLRIVYQFVLHIIK